MIRRLIILLLIFGYVFAQKDTLHTSKFDIFNKNKSIGIGIFANRSPNILQYTHNFKINKNISFYPLLGFPLYPLGIGFSWQQHYNQNGIALNLTGGFGGLLDDGIENWSSFSIFYQWEIDNSSLFTSLGIKIHIWLIEGAKWDTNLNRYPKEILFMPLPIISIEKRF